MVHAALTLLATRLRLTEKATMKHGLQRLVRRCRRYGRVTFTQLEAAAIAESLASQASEARPSMNNLQSCCAGGGGERWRGACGADAAAFPGDGAVGFKP